RSHLLSSPPRLRQWHRARPRDFASPPRLPLFRHGTPPKPPVAPSKHAPAEERSIRPRWSFRLAQTPRRRFQLHEPLFPVSARSPAIVSGRGRSRTLVARSPPIRPSGSFCLALRPKCCRPALPLRPAPEREPAARTYRSSRAVFINGTPTTP